MIPSVMYDLDWIRFSPLTSNFAILPNSRMRRGIQYFPLLFIPPSSGFQGLKLFVKEPDWCAACPGRQNKPVRTLLVCILLSGNVCISS